MSALNSWLTIRGDLAEEGTSVPIQFLDGDKEEEHLDQWDDLNIDYLDDKDGSCLDDTSCSSVAATNCINGKPTSS